MAGCRITGDKISPCKTRPIGNFWTAPDKRGPAGLSVLTASLLLIAANVFMTFAWYAHLRNMPGKHGFLAAMVSRGIALFEYLLQVPANRIGCTQMNLAQLKILQEVITLSVVVPFAIFLCWSRCAGIASGRGGA